MLRVVVIVGLLFMLSACNEKPIEQEQIKYSIKENSSSKSSEQSSSKIIIEKKKGVLMNKPSYTVKIKSVNTLIIINLNGERVWAQFNRHQLNLEFPVTQFMSSGKNKLEVLLFTDKTRSSKLSPKIECSVKLQVRESGNYKTKPQVISEIVYNYGDSNKSTAEGDYDSNNKFTLSPIGNIHISELERRELDESRYGEKIVGVGLIQYITLQTSLPRWKFLDSDNIVEGTFALFSDDKYEKIRTSKSIQGVYQKCQEIRNALKDKDLDKVMNYFTERSKELDIAFYEEEGYTQQILRKGFKEDLENSNLKLDDDPIKDCWVYISDGGKTIFIEDAITFSKIIGDGYNHYDMRFRLENGEWILTR